MGPSTMASPNGAQASEFPQAPLNHTNFDELSFLSELNMPIYNMPIYKMHTMEVINNGKQFQDPISSSSSSSAEITRPFDFDQEVHANDEGLATLENLLIQSGAINPRYNEGRSHPLLEAKPEVPLPLPHNWMPYEPQTLGLLGSSLSMLDNVTLNSGFSEGQQTGMPVMPMSVGKSISSEINLNDEIKDKSIERKQKRMIKNRESAARSRARKQAYIKQLEDTVKKLEDTNIQLKRQLEEMSPHSDSITEPRYQLRRTSSDQFN